MGRKSRAQLAKENTPKGFKLIGGTWKVRTRTEEGKRTWRGLGSGNLDEAKQTWASIQAEEASQKALRALVKGTVGELLDGYLEHAKVKYFDQHTQKLTSSFMRLRTLVDRLEKYRTLQTHEFTTEILWSLLGQWDTQGLHRKTVNGWLSLTKQIFRWGLMRGLVSVGTYTAISTVHPLEFKEGHSLESEPVEPVSDEIINATLPHLPTVVADAIRLQRITGARPGEILQLRPCDFQKGHVQDGVEYWVVDYAKTKDGHKNRNKKGCARYIAFGPEAQAILKKYEVVREPKNTRPRRHDEFLFTPREILYERLAKGEAIRCYPHRNRLDGNGLRWHLNAAFAKNPSLPHWAPNQVRHTVATALALTHGCDGEARVLGHAPGSTATRRYIEIGAENALRAATLLG